MRTTIENNSVTRKPIGRRWTSIRRWIAASTFTPPWLTGPWAHPIVGYLVASALQILAAVMTGLFAQVLGALTFSGALSFLVIALVALSWGVGPSLTATLVGATMLDFTALSPRFTWVVNGASEVVDLVLFLLVGVAISMAGSQAERNRRNARAAQSAAEAATARLAALQLITDTALGSVTLDDLLSQLLERITRALAVDNTAILLLNETSQELILHLAHGPEEALAGKVRIPLGQGIAGQIVVTREPRVVDDVRRATVANPFLQEHIRSLMSVPLLVNSRVIGVLHVGTRLPRRFTAGDLQLLQLMADRIALAIDHAQLYRAEQEARAQALAQAGQMEAVFEAAADAVFVFGREGQVLRTNAAARSLLSMDALAEYYSAPLRDRDYWTMVRGKDDQPLHEHQWPLFRVLHGEILTGAGAIDLTVRTVDGRKREISVSGAPVRDQQGEISAVVCIVRDVTERRQLERRTHEALMALVAMAQTLVLPMEETDRNDEHGLSTARTVGRRLIELTRNALGCRRVGIAMFDLQAGVQHPVAVAGLTPEQERAWWDSVEGAPIHDPRVKVDPELVTRFFAGEALVLDTTGPPFRDQPNPFDMRTVLIAPLRIGQAIVGTLSLDYGGEEHEYTADEKVLAVAVAHLTALTLERERLWREREEAQAQELALREMNQRMDEFLSIASHEIRSPLTSILGNAQLAHRRLQRARTRGDLTESELTAMLTPIAEMLQRIEEQSIRQARLINDLLDVSRIRSDNMSLHPIRLDLSALVRECVGEQRVVWPERTMTLDVPDTAVIVCGDADRIRQVVTNYLTNALKYSASNRPVAISLAAEGGVARVRVRDEGPGLTPEQQRHIWDRYRRVSGIAIRDKSGASGGGLGLGLYISRTIVEGHGGQVGVDSTPGKGAVFWLTLPLLPATSLPHTCQGDT